MSHWIESRNFDQSVERLTRETLTGIFTDTSIGGKHVVGSVERFLLGHIPSIECIKQSDKSETDDEYAGEFS